MRLIQVDVDRAQAGQAVSIAREEGARSPLMLPARGPDRRRAVVIALLPNDRVGRVIERLDAELEAAEFIILPEGVLSVRTPSSDLGEGLLQVSRRSTLELVLGALQSVGSWKGMLLYSAFSGLIATYGVIFDAIYLLVAAMLVAPMGAPAMVAVIGAATGDLRMIGRGALRFTVAILVLILSATVLGYAYGLDVPSETMEELTSLSGWIATLAVVGGAAGAQSQILSDRNSLVTATATGFLIAVALSPTSAVLGLALVLGDLWSVGAMAFVLALTFVGIVGGGALLLRVYGVRPGVPNPRPQSRAVRALAVASAVVATAGLVVWQAIATPSLRDADRSRDAIAIVRQAGRELGGVRVLDSSARFIRADGRGGDALLIRVTVAPLPAETLAAAVDSALASAIRRRIRERMPEATPYVHVTVAR